MTGAGHGRSKKDVRRVNLFGMVKCILVWISMQPEDTNPRIALQNVSS